MRRPWRREKGPSEPEPRPGSPTGEASPRAAGTGPATPAAEEEPLLDGHTVRALERLSLVYLDAIIAGVAGQRAGPTGGTGLEFADYRPYRPGDDLRRIDWNIYERLHELLVKVAPEEGHISLDVLIDSSRSMDWGRPNKLRYARRLAAALGTVALLRADTVRAAVLSDGQAFSTGRLDAPRLLVPLAREIERLPAGRGTDLPASMREYRRSTPLGDLTVLITDALVPPDSLAEALEELASAVPSTGLVHVIDQSEEIPPLRGPVELRDRETGQRLELTVSGGATVSYEAAFDRFCQAVEDHCQAAGVRYVRAPTDVDVLDLLSEPARAAGLVRV